MGRAVFWELENLIPIGWYVIDYSCDFVYLIDIFIRMHEGKYLLFFTLPNKRSGQINMKALKGN